MDIETVKKLVSYNPETGKLFWKIRSSEFFNCSDVGMKRAVSSWNARYSGMEITSKSTFGHIIVHFSIGKRWRTGAHRVAWAIHHGRWPDGPIDHINGDPSDNRLCNIRVCTVSQNNRNKKVSPLNTSGKIGVHFNKAYGKWVARIKVDKKDIGLGCYAEKEDAISARVAAELKYGFYEAEDR
jgi:hypothetical protein